MLEATWSVVPAVFRVRWTNRCPDLSIPRPEDDIAHPEGIASGGFEGLTPEGGTKTSKGGITSEGGI